MLHSSLERLKLDAKGHGYVLDEPVEEGHIALERLKPLSSLQWHLSKGRRRLAHPGSRNKRAATSDGLAKSPPLAPTPPWSALWWGQAARCSFACGDADAPARLHGGYARTHGEPSSCHTSPQSETRTALSPRQTTRGSRAQTGASPA